MKRSPSFPRVVLCSVVAQSVGEEVSFFKNCNKKKSHSGEVTKFFTCLFPRLGIDLRSRSKRTSIAAMRASPLPSSRGLAVPLSCSQSSRIVARVAGLARRRHPLRRPIDVVVAAAADSTPSSSAASSSESSSANFTRASYIAPRKYNTNDGSVSLPTRLSGTPMSREARRWFYDDAAESVDALLTTGLTKRASVKLTIPETNPEQDTFRIGTLLELVRAIALKRAKGRRGERVRVVVQPPLGEGFFKGMPLSLSGVSSLLSRMDWGEEGESEGEGGGAPTSARIATGVLCGGTEADGSGDNSAALGSPPCDLLIVVSPQNIVGGR